MNNIPIYLITNKDLCNEERYFKTLKEAGKYKNIKIILREKELAYEEYKSLYYKVKEIVPNTEIIINSQIKFFQDVKAKSIQLSFNDFMKNKSLKGIIGVSVHSLEEAIYADKKGADFLLASHIFETKCKEGLSPKGVSFIREIKENVNCKVIALGGINTENYQKIMKAGADGIAIMSLLFKNNNLNEIVQEFKI